MLALFVGLYFLVRSRSVAVLSAASPGIPAFLLGMLAALTGWALGLPRFLTYAGALCLAGAGVALANAEPELALAGGGIVILLSGAFRLGRFLENPRRRRRGE